MLSARAAWRTQAQVGRRAFAAADTAKKAAPAAAAAPASDAKKVASGGPTVKGIAYLKDTPEPPLLAPEQYPPWLAALADRPKNTVDRLAPADGHVFFKKSNLVQIKKDNFLKDKKR